MLSLTRDIRPSSGAAIARPHALTGATIAKVVVAAPHIGRIVRTVTDRVRASMRRALGLVDADTICGACKGCAVRVAAATDSSKGWG